MFTSKIHAHYSIFASNEQILERIKDRKWKIIKVPEFFDAKMRSQYLGKVDKWFGKFKSGISATDLAKKYGFSYENNTVTIPWNHEGSKSTIVYEEVD